MNNQFMFILCIYVFAQMFSVMMDGKTGFAGTVLTADLEIGDTVMTVVSTAAFLEANIVIIEDETIRYSGATATTFTGLTRGVESDEALHVTGATVFDEAPGFLNRLIITQEHAVECGAVDVFCWIKGKFKVVGVGASWISAIPQMLAFDYTYLDGMAIYIKMFFWILSAGLVLSFARIIWGR